MNKTRRLLLTVSALCLAFIASFTYKIGSSGWDFIFNGTVSDAKTSQAAEMEEVAKLGILARVITLVEDNYVDPARIQPKKMLLAALEEIQRTVAEVVVTPSPGEDEENPDSITVTVGQRSRRFDIDQVYDIFAMRMELKNMFQFILPNLTDTEIEMNRIEWAAINGILSTLDPHSIHMDPDSFADMKVNTQGKFGGLGIVISIRDGELTVISPIEDTPAARAGLKTGDKIVRINDESTINMPLTEAVEKLRGDVGTGIDIYVKRKGWAEPRKYSLTRALVKIKSVISHLNEEDGVGYVKIRNFQANSTEDMQNQITQLKEQAEKAKKAGKGPGFKGLILDLRNNPGGLLDQAIRVADTFVDEGVIVSTVGVDAEGTGKPDRGQDHKYATKPGTMKDFPLIVLVNPGSASASEIVAGAIQNLNRGIVLGQTTFGKGSVQVLYELQDESALKLTISQYLTPGGISIQSYGITPDISTVPMVAYDKRVALTYREDEMREADLDAHLVSENSVEPQDPAWTVKYYLEPELDELAVEDGDGGGDENKGEGENNNTNSDGTKAESGHEAKTDDDDDSKAQDKYNEYSDKYVEDFQIKLASSIIVNGGTNRQDMLKSVGPIITKSSMVEMEKVKAALHELGIDWTPGQNPSHMDLQAGITTKNGENSIKAGDKVIFVGKVTNHGSDPVHQIRGITESPNDHLNGREFVFGRLNPGETKIWEIKLDIPKELRTRMEPISMKVLTGYNDDKILAKNTTLLSIEEKERPAFAFDYRINDQTSGNGDGALQPGEEVEVGFKIHNIGSGVGKEVIVSLSSKAGKNIYLKKGRETLKGLKKDTTEEVTFSFTVAPNVPVGEELDLNLTIFDTDVREWINEKLPTKVVAPANIDKESRTLRIPAGTTIPVYIAADDSYPILTRLGGPASIKAEGSAGSFYKIQLQVSSKHDNGKTTGKNGNNIDSGFGWIKKSDVEGNSHAQTEGGSRAGDKPDTGKGTTVDAGAPASYQTAPKGGIMFRPASITIEKSGPQNLISLDKTYHLKSMVKDDQHVKDYWVYQYSKEGKRFDAKKVTYVPNPATGKSPDRVYMDIPITLKEGVNQIQIHVRDNQNLITTEEVVVFHPNEELKPIVTKLLEQYRQSNKQKGHQPNMPQGDKQKAETSAKPAAVGRTK